MVYDSLISVYLNLNVGFGLAGDGARLMKVALLGGYG